MFDNGPQAHRGILRECELGLTYKHFLAVFYILHAIQHKEIFVFR